MSIANQYNKAYQVLIKDLDDELQSVERAPKKVKELLALIEICDSKRNQDQVDSNKAEKEVAKFLTKATPNQKAKLYELIDEIEAQSE